VFGLPVYVWALVLLAVIGIPTAMCTLWYLAATRTGALRGRAARRGVAAAASLWAGWVMAAALLARSGAFRQQHGTVRPWLAVAAGGVLLVTLLVARLPAAAAFVLEAPSSASRLVWPHTLRVAGVVFVIVAALGHLPAVFALPAGLGDLAVGLSAPWVARSLARGASHARAIWFNLAGLADLVLALTLGFLSGLGPNRLHVTPSSAPVALLPLALIPTTAVPLAVALHILSLSRLRHATTLSPTPAPPADNRPFPEEAP
jgi:hypothetical protein